MGADFIATYVDMGESSEAFIANLRDGINLLPEAILIQAHGEIFPIDDYDDDEINYKNDLNNLIDDFEKIIISYKRDISILTIKDSLIAITGGMSWGDDPTDSFDTLNKIAVLSDYVYLTSEVE